MQIAAVTCQREIARIVGTAVLLRYDMFHMVGQFAIFLPQTAVFATLGSPTAHKFPRCRIHLLLNVRAQLLARFEL